MPPLYKLESRLALANAAFSLDENSYPGNFNQRTVQQRLRCKRGIEKISEDIDKFAGTVRADENRGVVTHRILQKGLRRMVLVRKNNTCDRVVKIALERFLEFFGGDTADERMFTLPEHLHAVMRKVLEKAVESKSRPVDVDIAQLAVEVCVCVDKADLQTIRVFQQFPDFDRFQLAGLFIMIPPFSA